VAVDRQRGVRLAVLAVLTILAGGPLAAADAPAPGGAVAEAVAWLGVRVDPARLVNQHLHPGDGACVPATLLNALRCGPADFRQLAGALPGASDRERLDGIIGVALGMPSAIEPGQPCYSESNGVRADDIPPLFARLLRGSAATPPTGRYLDRVGDESVQAQVQRIHALLLASLGDGVPVVLSLRSFAASHADEGGEFRWNGLSGHAVLLVALPRVVGAGALGFPMRLIDPATASVQECYVRGEVVRGFKAVKGSGSKDFAWVENAFLQVDLPGLPLGTQYLHFYERSFIILNYAVGRFPAPPAP
jgi:hypothetical protein